jgi:hypothetical protein
MGSQRNCEESTNTHYDGNYSVKSSGTFCFEERVSPKNQPNEIFTKIRSIPIKSSKSSVKLNAKNDLKISKIIYKTLLPIVEKKNH